MSENPEHKRRPSLRGDLVATASALFGLCVLALFWWMVYFPPLPMTSFRLWLGAIGGVLAMFGLNVLLERTISTKGETHHEWVVGLLAAVLFAAALATLPVGALYNWSALKLNFSELGMLTVSDLDRAGCPGDILKVTEKSTMRYLEGQVATQEGVGSFVVESSSNEELIAKGKSMPAWTEGQGAGWTQIESSGWGPGVNSLKQQQVPITAELSLPDWKLTNVVAIEGRLTEIPVKYPRLANPSEFTVVSDLAETQLISIWVLPRRLRPVFARARGVFIRPPDLGPPGLVLALGVLFLVVWLAVAEGP